MGKTDLDWWIDLVPDAALTGVSSACRTLCSSKAFLGASTRGCNHRIEFISGTRAFWT